MSEDKIKMAMKNAKASLEVEGLNIDGQGENLVLDKLSGRITEDEFLKRAKKLAEG